MIGVLGAGAFGTALAVALAQDGRKVMLWGRDADTMGAMAQSRQTARLPGVTLPEGIEVTADLARASTAETLLLAVPMQTLSSVLGSISQPLEGQKLVACCKGIDLATGEGPSHVIAHAKPGALPAILTGPSFAADIARGLPTALTLACADAKAGAALQARLSTPVLRIYLSDDPRGAELGGALKNVVAIAAGAAIGAGLGDSARAAIITRGFAEMMRLAPALEARSETLSGLAGFGDLVLTCTSEQSRNFRFGLALGQGRPFDPGVTVEGAATARAVARLAAERGLDLPVLTMVAALSDGRLTAAEAAEALLARPLTRE